MRGTIRPAAFIERNEKSSRKDKEHDGISFDLYPHSKQGLESYDLRQPWPLRRPFTQLCKYCVVRQQLCWASNCLINVSKDFGL